MYASRMPPSDSRGPQAKLQIAKRAPSEALQKLRRGELTLDAYLDEATEVALAKVAGRVVGEALQNLRETLREHIRTDPVMVELLRQLAGHAPNPDSSEPKN